MKGWLDAHMHIWQLKRGDYDWLTPDLAPIYQDFAIKDVWPEAKEASVESVILVQAAPSVEESLFLLDVAADDARVVGVVGWIDFESVHWKSKLDLLLSREHLVGIRPMIGDLDDPAWILDDRFVGVIDALSEHSLVLDLHAKPEHIEPCSIVAERNLGLRMVLDHCGKPPLASGEIRAWRDALEKLASHTNVSCKISGLLTECGPDPDLALLRDTIAYVLDCFGPERVIWGSDWPVLAMSGTYRRWASLSREIISELAPANGAAIFRDNARRMYGV
ncbi:amidohydrolase family protein [Altererythrobacter lutimaris]|uniref:Amidohydrolase family protein n=1 Tax=Altererythrobacter lutimaris TaxID=2743979 RepID=A0A850H5D0_9SPHN|nr:amidohydrolase family protein [Altererythrobacter lutimaris]NVE94367.1 amidohydrolase family protein [Altererythrobacter lutimaris]